MKWTTEQTYRKLSGIIDANIGQYQFQACRYLNNPLFNLRSTFEYNTWFQSLQYAQKQDDDLMSPASINIIKSCIDSLVSKIANIKVRPYFNTVNGDYNSKRTTRAVQEFFDIFYDEQQIHEKTTEAFRQACIFGIGYLFINPITNQVQVLNPWNLGLLTQEVAYNQDKATKMLVRFYRYPTTFLNTNEYTTDYVDYSLLIDTDTHQMVEYINGNVVKTHKYKPSVLPIVPIYYNKPLFGLHTTSLVQELEGIQEQIDLISTKIAAASELTPANTTYVMSDSTFSSETISNRTGTIIPIKGAFNATIPPVVNVQPIPFDGQWLELLKYYVKQAYEITGISETYAVGKKTKGINSGTALQTIADIESQRFQTQVDHFTNSFVELAKKMIQVFDDNSLITKKSGITWKQVKNKQDDYIIQYSSASMLSKDPEQKLNQILQLMQMGLIGQEKVSQYLDTPDLEDAYESSRVSFDAVQKCIQECIDNNVYTIPSYIDTNLLSQEIETTLNQIYSCINNNNYQKSFENINKLNILKNTIIGDNNANQDTQESTPVS